MANTYNVHHGLQVSKTVIGNVDLDALLTTPYLAIPASGIVPPVGTASNSPSVAYQIDIIKATIWFDFNGYYYGGGVPTININSVNPVTNAIGPAILTNSTAMVNPNSCYQEFVKAPLVNGLTQYAPGFPIYITTQQNLTNIRQQTGTPVGGVFHAHLRIWIYYQIQPYMEDQYTLATPPGF